MKKYVVVLSAHATHRVSANSPRDARQKVWNYMSRGYTYGWTKNGFLRNAKVVQVSK